jgi:urease accessory protein
MKTSLVALLHLCDSLFPIGAFSHSDGLEAAVSSGAVRDRATLGAWMEVVLAEGLGRVDAPAVCRAWRSFGSSHWALAVDVDDELHALRPSAAGRAASRAMGTRLLKTWHGLRPIAGLDALLQRHPRVTLPVAFGVAAASAGIDERATVEGYCYTRLAAVVSAAMRLAPIGQQDGHALLAEALERVPDVVDAVIQAPAPPIVSFTPAFDLAAMSQQYGHSRLFRS